jgi:iron complex outermembrane receptor protein
VNDARGDYLSWGIYGDVSFEVTDRLELIAGARYSRDRKDVRLASSPVSNTISLISGGNAFLRAGTQRAEESWGQFQPRAVVNYRPTSELLTYFSFTRGYKSGGFNVLQPGDPAFAPEKVTQFELGAKGTLLDRRMQFELAAYHWSYSDLQVQVFDGGLPVVRNAGRAEAWGLDASVNALVTSGFQLVGSVSLLDAKYKEFSPQPGVDFAGNRPALAPEFSGRMGFEFTHDFARAGTVSVKADYNYQSRVFFSPDNGPLQQDGFGLLSGRISYTLPSGKAEIGLRGENLTNERYASSGQAISTINLAQLRLGQPRLVAIDATLRW